MTQQNQRRAHQPHDRAVAAHGAFWVGVVLCGVALSGCSGSGPVQPPGVGAPAKLAFIVQPSNAVAGAASTPAVQVAVQDAQGNTVTTATTSITLAIGINPASGTLSGTTTVAAVNGIATLANLSINNPGTGYTLTASATGLTGATSSAFNISTGATVAPVRVRAGGFHTCGVTLSGAADCWGNNPYGQLGNGTTTNSDVPVAVSGGLAFAAVSAGNTHTCGVTPSGAAYCWGDNLYGELGNGATTTSDVPVAVSGGLTFAAVGAGAVHTCGVTPS